MCEAERALTICLPLGFYLRLPLPSIWRSHWLWPWEPWWKGYVRPGEEMLEASDTAITKAQWWNGYLATSPHPDNHDEEAVWAQHDKWLLFLKEKGVVLTALPKDGSRDRLRFRSAITGSAWDLIVTRPEARAEHDRASA